MTYRVAMVVFAEVRDEDAADDIDAASIVQEVIRRELPWGKLKHLTVPISDTEMQTVPVRIVRAMELGQASANFYVDVNPAARMFDQWAERGEQLP